MDNFVDGSTSLTGIGLLSRSGVLSWATHRLCMEGTEMRKNTLLKVLLAGFASLTLICAPQSLFAQHGSGGGGSHGGSGGGSHGGGGGGFQGGGGGGSVHRGGYGGFHGGAGSYGGYRGIVGKRELACHHGLDELG